MRLRGSKHPWGTPERLTEGGAQSRDEIATAALVSQLPPGEPDDLTVERVWRRLASPRTAAASKPRWRWVAVTALTTCAAAVVLSLWLWPTRPALELSQSSGRVLASRLAEGWHTSTEGERLAEGERVRTEENGHALLRIGKVAAVLLGEGADVGIEKISHGTFLRLSRGSLTARVSKRKADEPFVVLTDRYRVTVVGTLFTVELGPGELTTVSVREGVVEVSDGKGQLERVIAGTRWTSADGAARTADHTPEAVKLVLEEGLRGDSDEELEGDFVSAVAKPLAALPPPPVATTTNHDAPPAVPQGATVPMAKRVPSLSPTPRRVTVVPVAPSGASGAALEFAQTPPMAPNAVAPAPVLAPPPVVLAPSAAAPVPPAGIQPTVAPPPLPTLAASAPAPAVLAPEASYAAAQALEARGDLDGAAAAFAHAADSDPARGDLALYALGRLAQRRLHDSKRALSAFRSYRDRYPSGALMPEVDFAVLELEVQDNARTAALVESERFLTTHPESERAPNVRLLHGNLLRDSGAYQGALADYAQLRTGPEADDALYSSAYCERKLGNRAAAATTLRDYLQRLPNGAHRAAAEQALAPERDDEKAF